MDDKYEVMREIERNEVDKIRCEAMNEAEKYRFADEMKNNFEIELKNYDAYPQWVKKPLSIRLREKWERIKIKLKNTF
jgi:hypothetical protein